MFHQHQSTILEQKPCIRFSVLVCLYTDGQIVRSRRLLEYSIRPELALLCCNILQQFLLIFLCYAGFSFLLNGNYEGELAKRVGNFS